MMMRAVFSSHEGGYYSQYLHGWMDYGWCMLLSLSLALGAFKGNV